MKSKVYTESELELNADGEWRFGDDSDIPNGDSLVTTPKIGRKVIITSTWRLKNVVKQKCQSALVKLYNFPSYLSSTPTNHIFKWIYRFRGCSTKYKMSNNVVARSFIYIFAKIHQWLATKNCGTKCEWNAHELLLFLHFDIQSTRQKSQHSVFASHAHALCNDLQLTSVSRNNAKRDVRRCVKNTHIIQNFQ